MTPEEARLAINSLGAAFAAADVEAVVALFSADGDVMYAGSEVAEVAVGHTALRRLLQCLFAREERYSWQCDAVQVVACPSGYAVLGEATLSVHATGIRGGDPASVSSVPYRVSGMMEESAGQWCWRFCHGSEPAAA